MTQEQYTTKQRKFQHITKEKRAQIEILLRQGTAKIQIARAVGISRSTLYNELRRGTIEQIDTNLKRQQRYFWDVGQRVYEENRKNSCPPLKLMKAYDFIHYAEKQISLVRRFFPKGKSFDNITDEQIAFVESWINNLPRKIFNYHSADFIFKSVLFDIAI